MTTRHNTTDRLPPLTVEGNSLLLRQPAIGICGSRYADDLALDLAEKFGRFVAKLGLVLVSGNARGVDDAAQFGALDHGGAIVSVLAEGLAGWKPRARYRRLITRENHAAVSEFPDKARWQVWQAMQRNGTILDLSLALVVVQSGESGGTWEAGVECLRRSKPLLVVQRQEPPETEGNAQLIRRGGIAVSSTQQLTDLLKAIRDGRGTGKGQLPLPGTDCGA